MSEPQMAQMAQITRIKIGKSFISVISVISVIRGSDSPPVYQSPFFGVFCVFRGPVFVLNFEPLRFAILNLFVICRTRVGKVDMKKAPFLWGVQCFHANVPVLGIKGR